MKTDSPFTLLRILPEAERRRLVRLASGTDESAAAGAVASGRALREVLDEVYAEDPASRPSEEAVEAAGRALDRGDRVRAAWDREMDERLATTDIAADKHAAGQPVVTLDEDGNVVRHMPDGTLEHVTSSRGSMTDGQPGLLYAMDQLREAGMDHPSVMDWLTTPSGWSTTGGPRSRPHRPATTTASAPPSTASSSEHGLTGALTGRRAATPG